MCSRALRKETDELNRNILPPDVKIRPYYDRSDLVRVTTDTVEGNLAPRHGSGLVGPRFFFWSVFVPPSSRRSPSHWRCFSPSFSCTLPGMLRICSPSAPSTSASSSTAPSSWWKTFTANSPSAERPALRPARRDHRRRPRRRSPDLLFRGRHHRRVSSRLALSGRPESSFTQWPTPWLLRSSALWYSR